MGLLTLIFNRPRVTMPFLIIDMRCEQGTRGAGPLSEIYIGMTVRKGERHERH